jgi:hypothetical protein
MYFIFRDVTYVVSSVFACLMIIGELAVGVRILLEKGPSRHHISEDQQFQENTQSSYFIRRRKWSAGESERSSQGPTPPGGAGQPQAASPSGVATLAHFYQCPFAYIVVPENLRQRGIRDRLCRLCGAENTERESSPIGRNLSGKFLSGEGWASSGSSSSSPSSLAPSSSPSSRHPTVTSWVESYPIFRGNFSGVDYSYS